MAPASASDDQSISSSSHRRIQSTSNSHGHLAAAPPLHHHTHPHPYYAQDIKQTASPSTIFSTFEGYSRPTSPVWEVDRAQETEQDSRSQVPASASSESAICIPSGSANVWPRSTLEVEGEEQIIIKTLELGFPASEAKYSRWPSETCSGFIDRTAEEAQNSRHAALKPTTTSNAVTTTSIAREHNQENMGSMYVHSCLDAPSGSQSRAHAHYKDKEVHMQKQDGSTYRPRPTCTAFIEDQEKSKSSAWPLSNTSTSTYTDLPRSTRSDGIQDTAGQADCSYTTTITAEAEELQKDPSTTRAASDAVRTDLDSDRLSSSGRQRISASHPSSSRSTSTIYDRRQMHHKCTHASEVSANSQLNQHSQEETSPLSATDEEITASTSKTGQRDQKTVDSLSLHLDGLGAKKINDRTMVSSVFSVDENVVVDGDNSSMSSPSQQSISTKSSAPLLDETISDQNPKEDDTLIRASSKNVISSSPKSLTFVTSTRNPAASTARTTAATTSSTVKASSPLRIITTPLPVTSDSDSSGAEAAPVGRSLTAASSIAYAKLSNLTSISSSSSDIKYSRASGLGIIDTSATSESAPSSSSSMAMTYDSAITPTASPYSSIFTARSDWPSSVPTTANSSFPSSASYTSSACSSAVPTYNSLQLIQQQQQQQYKQSTRTSTEASSQNVTETYQVDVNGRSDTSHNNHNNRRSRYADFASPNIASNYDWFTQNCPPSNRPPLLRSVSEDTAPVYSSPTSNRTPSKSQFKQRGNAIRQLGPLHVGNADDRATSQTLNGLRYDSLQMGPRALTAPYFALSAAVEAGIDASKTGITNAAAPPSESSSRNASTSISSHSSFSTAPSSKRSSWCSPPALSGEPLPPISLSGRSTPISHIANATPTKVAGATPFKPRHSASYSVNSALPLSRTNHAHQRASGDRRSTFPSPASSAPSSITDAGEKDATEIDSTLLASFDPAVAEAIRQAAATVRSQMGNVGTAGADGGFEAPKGFTGHQQGHFPPNSVHQSTGNLSAMQNSLMGACGNGYFGNAIRAKVGPPTFIGRLACELI